MICTWSYQGVSTRLIVEPANDPYRAREWAVEDAFAIRIVYLAEPADLATVAIYVYDPEPQGAQPMHESKYRPPFSGGSFGFTGLQAVYRPEGDELIYFCEWK